MPQVGAPIQVKKHELHGGGPENCPTETPSIPFPRLEKIKGTFRVRVRFYEGQAMGSVWLLRKEGAQEECVMHGQITKDKAGEVMEWFLRLGIVCSYEIVSLQTGVESAELNSGARSGDKGRKKKGAV